MKQLHIKPEIPVWSLLLVPALLLLGCRSQDSGEDPIRFYVGSSDTAREYVIFLCELNAGSGIMTLIDSFAGARGPSYLAFSPEQQYLYAINKEIFDTASGNMTVTGFRVDRTDHGLEVISNRSSQGAGPCHVHCSREGDFLFTANYTSGNIAVFPLSETGMIEPASCAVQSSGTGPVEGRQEGPHTHYVTLDPGENFLLSPDLGSDKVLVYRFNKDMGTLSPNLRQPFLKMTPGSGPRHLDFHPSGRFVYVVNELSGTVTACSYEPEKGELTRLNEIRTMPESYAGKFYPAAVRVHPGGKFLYASIRGERNSIAVFSISEDGGIARIQVVENVPAWPRDFNIGPSGKYLIAAGERSGLIRLYLIDPDSGLLERTEFTLQLPAPACILFIHRNST